MTDIVRDGGDVASKLLATSIMNEVGLEPTELGLEPLTDICHRLLEFGVPEAALQDMFSDLLSELQRAGTLNSSFEDIDEEDEEEVESYSSDHLFSPRDDDAY